MDYTEQITMLETQLEQMQSTLEQTNELVATSCETLGYITGFGVFVIVVVLCVFTYKFFRMFF